MLHTPHSATVIKGSQRSAAATPFNLDDVQRQARDYLDRVRAEAQQIVAHAETEAQQIRCAAAEQGKADGRAALDDAIAQGVAQQLQGALDTLRSVVAELQRSQLDCQTIWEQRLVQLASAMAARVVRRELRGTPEITLDYVREALQLAAGSPQLRILLHPADCRTLMPEIEQIVAECAPAAAVEIVASETISAGGCRVETRFGSIDQQVEVQLARLVEELS